MDISIKQEKWRQERPLFEAEFIHSHLLPFFNFNESTGDYETKSEFAEDEDRKLAYEVLNTGWVMWLRAKRDAKARAVPKWISVKDKLPSDDIGRVLAWVVEQNSLGKCGFVWNCSHSNGVFSDKFETFQVTHWMPLPDAPQEPADD